MLIKIAWRNIWRSKGRSMVVMGSIIVGIWALISAVGFMNGFMVGYMADIINHDISNIQIHNPEFKSDQEVKYVIPDGKKKVNEIRKWTEVEGATSRIIVSGMIASARKGSAVQIRGVDKSNEAKVTELDSLVNEGTYFDGIKRNPILLGKKLAEELKVKVKSKVILTFMDESGTPISARFRVAGIINTSSVNLNEMTAFVLNEDIGRLLGSYEIHEIAILTMPRIEEEVVLNKYNDLFKGDLVETWTQVAPELELLNEMYGSMMYVLVFIVMMALVFGIVNTMLMAVLERIRELGMLMAVGMTRIKVFLMVLLETIFLGILGSPIGLFFGWLMMYYYTTNGIDLSAYSEGLESFGYSSILYPYVDSSTYLIVTVSVIITAFIGAVYPAWKAIKLKPVEALHAI